MKAYVFTDKALQRHAGQFVWLSLDVEKGQNAPYKKKYGIDALPTYFVVDPKTEKSARTRSPRRGAAPEEGRGRVRDDGGGSLPAPAPDLVGGKRRGERSFLRARA